MNVTICAQLLLANVEENNPIQNSPEIFRAFLVIKNFKSGEKNSAKN